jgi:hypothetical protein
MFCRTHDAMLLVEYKDGQFWNLRNNELHQKLTGFSHIEGTARRAFMGGDRGKLTGYFERCISTGRPVVYEQTYKLFAGQKSMAHGGSPVFSQGQIGTCSCAARELPI